MYKYYVTPTEDGRFRLTIWDMAESELTYAAEFNDIEDLKDYLRDEWPGAKSEETLNQEKA